MILGIFLSPGDSLKKQAFSGQDERFIQYYLKTYSKNFQKIFVFSYGDNDYQKSLPPNVFLLPNKYNIPYLIYQFLICFFYPKEFKGCQIFRVMQIPGGIPAFMAKIFLKKKIIATYGFNYSLFAKIEEKFLPKIFMPVLTNIVLNASDSIIVTSKENYAFLKKNYSNKLKLITNSVNPNLFKPTFEKQHLRKEGKKITIISVGRLVKQKNQELLIKATSLSRYKDSLEILLIGDGPLKNFLLDTAVKYGVDLKIIKKVGHKKLPRFLNKARFFCLPSLIEGQPKTLLEALSCGLVCLASNIPSHREIIKDKVNGILFDLAENDLKEKIEWLVENKKFAGRLSFLGRKLIKENYNIFKNLEKEIKVIKQC